METQPEHPLVSAAPTMQLLEGEGKINSPTTPQHLLGVPSPPDPHCVDTRCQHLPWGILPGWDCSWCCSPLASRRRRRRARRGRLSVSVCLSVRLRGGEQLCVASLPAVVRAVSPEVFLVRVPRGAASPNRALRLWGCPQQGQAGSPVLLWGQRLPGPPCWPHLVQIHVRALSL